TSILPRFSMAKPYCTDLLSHDYGLRPVGCQELRTRPGSTLFMPITDVPLGYINMLMLLFQAPHRLYIYDDLNTMPNLCNAGPMPASSTEKFPIHYRSWNGVQHSSS